MLRKAVAKKIASNNKSFRLRGHEVRRIEAFSDAVFAFAVTLLIVSLEVPKSFEELMITMRGFFAFGISFLLLMMIWHEQNIFFRRYGLDDTITIALNGALIFLVLLYVYPLKFLFTLIFNNQIYSESSSPLIMSVEHTPELMTIYSAGFAGIYFLFYLMYAHAIRKKEQLDLTETERYDTKTKMYSQLIFIFTALFTVLLTWLLPLQMAGFAGFTYFIIGPAFTFFYGYRGRRRKKIDG